MKTRLFAVVLLVVCLVMCVVPAYAGSSATFCPNCGDRLDETGNKTKYSAAYSSHVHQLDHTVCKPGIDYNKYVCTYNRKSGTYYASLRK